MDDRKMALRNKIIEELEAHLDDLMADDIKPKPAADSLMGMEPPAAAEGGADEEAGESAAEEAAEGASGLEGTEAAGDSEGMSPEDIRKLIELRKRG